VNDARATHHDGGRARAFAAMSTSAVGRIVDHGGDPLPGLRVVMKDESALFSADLGTADSQGDGTFTVTYGGDLTPDLGTRKLGIYVFTLGHRQLSYQTKDDVSDPQLTLGDIEISHNEATGYTVTLGGSTAALPVTDGNAVRPLIDDEDAWGHVKDSMLGAITSIDVMQLEFDMPRGYNDAPDQEYPEIIVSFDGAVDPLNPRPVTKPTDYRPERILLDKAAHGVKVKVLISHTSINWLLLGVDVLIMLVPLIFLIVFDVGKSWKLLAGLLSSKPGGGFSAVKDYFMASGGLSDIKAVDKFDTSLYNVVHAKLVMVDDTEAIVLGSPFSQSYFDDHNHHILDPRRGSAAGEPVPVHDVSMAVRGPAVKDIHDAFRMHWNKGKDQQHQIAEIQRAAAVTTPSQGESIASLQLVRTLNGGAFTELPDGEKGCFEAYLRAIESAQTYIYLENQYFTNETIGKALVAALNDKNRKNLQIIVMLNVTPDLPFYPVWQSNLIERIRKDATDASRIGFFTAWSHDAAVPQLGHPKPMIAANYLHTKAAIVDGVWATVGSANLDGASLDYFQLLHAIQFGDNRNHELNYCIFNGIEGHPSTDAIDKLRIGLWSEHLGIDPTDPKLASSQANNAGWLKLWKNTAEAKRSGLENDPATINPANGRVLEYPANALTGLPLLLPWKNPERDFLTSAQIKFDNLELVEQVPAFSFHDGKWA
jgi:phosphatidylserine/phosphatidylglycerophosphate/cardiolipin synthase-like enzyme